MSTDTPIHNADQDFWEEQFVLLQQDPLVWAMNADELNRGFELLAQQAEADGKEAGAYFLALCAWRNDGTPQPHYAPLPRVSSTARMLGGYTLETILKGIAVSLPANQQGLRAKSRETASRLFHHRLRELAIEAQVDLTSNEALLCERLEQFTVWAGRYPVPKQPNGLLPRKLPDGSILPLTSSTDDDFPAIRVLIQRLRPLLPMLNYAQPYSLV